MWSSSVSIHFSVKPSSHKASQGERAQCQILPKYKSHQAPHENDISAEQQDTRERQLWKLEFSKNPLAFLSYFVSPALRISASFPAKSSTSIPSSRLVFLSYYTESLAAVPCISQESTKILLEIAASFIRFRFAKETKIFVSIHRKRLQNMVWWLILVWLQLQTNWETVQTLQNEHTHLVCSPPPCNSAQSPVFLVVEL